VLLDFFPKTRSSSQQARQLFLVPSRVPRKPLPETQIERHLSQSNAFRFALKT